MTEVVHFEWGKIRLHDEGPDELRVELVVDGCEGQPIMLYDGRRPTPRDTVVAGTTVGT